MDVNSSSPARTPKLQPAAEEPLTGECWIPPKKYTSGPRAKAKPQQDGRRGKVTFRIKPHTQQRSSEGLNKTLCVPGPRPHRDWARPAFECLSISHGGTGHQWLATWAGALGAADLGDTACGLLEEVAINPTIELPSRRPTNCRTIIPNKFWHC